MVVINENNDYSELVNNIRSEENVLNVVLVNYQSVSVLKGDDKQDVSLIVPEEFNKLNDVIFKIFVIRFKTLLVLIELLTFLVLVFLDVSSNLVPHLIQNLLPSSFS